MKKRIEPGTAIFDPIKGRDIIIHDVNMIQKVAHCAVLYSCIRSGRLYYY